MTPELFKIRLAELEVQGSLLTKLSSFRNFSELQDALIQEANRLNTETIALHKYMKSDEYQTYLFNQKEIDIAA